VAAGQAMRPWGKPHSQHIRGVLVAPVRRAAQLQPDVPERALCQSDALLACWRSLLAFEIVSDFIPALFAMSLFIAIAGGLLSLVWWILVGRDLLRLATVVHAEPALAPGG
jgi:hypothetical protein